MIVTFLKIRVQSISYTSVYFLNKTGTSKVGAISKAQKFLKLLKGGPSRLFQIQFVAKYQQS